MSHRQDERLIWIDARNKTKIQCLAYNHSCFSLYLRKKSNQIQPADEI